MRMRASWGAALIGSLAVLAAVSAVVPARGRAAAHTRVLRVCADPNNLPFSNARREGFEDRLASMLAEDLNASLRYVWHAQRRGFVRETLAAGRCDVMLGVPSSGDEQRRLRDRHPLEARGREHDGGCPAAVGGLRPGRRARLRHRGDRRHAHRHRRPAPPGPLCRGPARRRPPGGRGRVSGRPARLRRQRALGQRFVRGPRHPPRRADGRGGRRPWGVAVSPDGGRLYTANGGSDDVSFVDTTTGAVVGRVAVGDGPWGVTVVR